MSMKQTDSNGNSFVINNLYEIDDEQYIYLGYGIEEATTNPNFIGVGLGSMYKDTFVFQSVTNPKLKIPIYTDGGLIIKPVSKPTRIYENGRYEGFLDEKNEPHGNGIMIYLDGTTIEGEWNHGQKIVGKMKEWKEQDGVGTMTYDNGDVYKGVWKDKNHGVGTITYANGDNYEGEWKEDKKHGSGKFIHEDESLFGQDIYEGEWKENKKDGNGSQLYDDGDLYQGQWKENKKDGIGTMSYDNGDVYNGNWKENKKDGAGAMSYDNGNVYKGDWKDDKKEGNGIMIYKSKVICQGKWLNDKPNGNGSLIINGVTIFCLWGDNNFISYIQEINNNQTVISITDILPFINNATHFIPSFYTLVGLSQTPDSVDSFLKKMKTYQGTVIIAALCHGELLAPIPLPIQRLHRINKVVNGVCVFTSITDRLELIDICLSNTQSNIVPIIQSIFIQTTKTDCNDKICNYKDKKEYLNMFDNMRGLSKSPDKFAEKGNLVFNKNFTSDGTGINVLFLMDEEGNHINLFSSRQYITLEEVFSMIPECSRCIFIDDSCSSPGLNKETGKYYEFTQDEYDSYGGTRKKSKKQKTKRNKLKNQNKSNKSKK